MSLSLSFQARHPGFPFSGSCQEQPSASARQKLYKLMYILPNAVWGSPEKPDEETVKAAPIAVNRDPGADQCKSFGRFEGRKLRALHDIHDLEWDNLLEGRISLRNSLR